MSPEQAAGSRDVDGRSDIYSLACVVYEMLAGQAPFTGPTAESLVHQHLSVAPRPVTEVRPTVPSGTAAALARALAKAPADRYATTERFLEALERTAAEPKPRKRWLTLIPVVVVVLGAVAYWQGWWRFGGGAGPPAKKDWILVAEFESAPEDTNTAAACRDLVCAALDQSRIVAAVSREQIKQALQAAGRPADTRLDAEMAHELAYRSAVQTVLEGRVGRLGFAYTIVLRLVDAETARVLFTESATAKNDDALIPTLGDMAKRLRRRLGETQRALMATRPMTQAATPSFEAYRLYVQAHTAREGAGALSDPLAICDRALKLDPDFAMVYAEMGYIYARLGGPDSARVCLLEALRRPERLTDVQRQLLEIQLADNEGDLRRALTAAERLEHQEPANVLVLRGCHDVLAESGRSEQALDWTRRAMALSPFGPTEQMRIDEISDLLHLGRVQEARVSERSLGGKHKITMRLWIELAAGEFAVAESIATVHLDDPDFTSEEPSGRRYWLAMAQAGRGAIRAAVATTDRSVAIYSSRADVVFPEQVSVYWNDDARRVILWSILGREPMPPLPGAGRPDTSTMSLLTQGLRAAFAGDERGARNMLDATRGRPERDLKANEGARVLLQTRIAALAGRPDESIGLMQPLDAIRWGLPGPGWGLFKDIGIFWARWVLADAFERSGRADSAAFYLERSFTAEDIRFLPAFAAGVQPYAHQRLALLYARLGRAAEAERHLEAAEKAWDRPDPEVRLMLEEARGAVRTARVAVPPGSGSVDPLVAGGAAIDPDCPGRLRESGVLLDRVLADASPGASPWPTSCSN